MNKDFGVTRDAICPWFSLVTSSLVKIIGKSPHSSPKIGIHGNSCIILYLFHVQQLRNPYQICTRTTIMFSFYWLFSWNYIIVNLHIQWGSLPRSWLVQTYLKIGNPKEGIKQYPLHWRQNDHDGVSNHQQHGCLLNRLFSRRSKQTSKLRVTGLCVGNSPGPVNSPHKGPVTRKMIPFDDVIMSYHKYKSM